MHFWSVDPTIALGSNNGLSMNTAFRSKLFDIFEGSSILSMFCVGSLCLMVLVGFCSVFRLANSPERRLLLAMILSTLYLDVSKFVIAFTPRNLIAAMSYASAASSCVPGYHCNGKKLSWTNKAAKEIGLVKCCRLIFSKEHS